MLLQGGESLNVDERLATSGDFHGGIADASMLGRHSKPGYNHDYHGAIPQSLEGRAISALSRFGENAKMTSDPVWLNRLRRSPEFAGIVYISGYGVLGVFS